MSENHRYALATLVIEVTRTNEFPPHIESKIGPIGYIYENAPRGTIVTNALGNRAMQLVVTDPDQVSYSLCQSMFKNDYLFSKHVTGFQWFFVVDRSQFS